MNNSKQKGKEGYAVWWHDQSSYWGFLATEFMWSFVSIISGHLLKGHCDRLGNRAFINPVQNFRYIFKGKTPEFFFQHIFSNQEKGFQNF